MDASSAGSTGSIGSASAETADLSGCIAAFCDSETICMFNDIHFQSQRFGPNAPGVCNTPQSRGVVDTARQSYHVGDASSVNPSEGSWHSTRDLST
jgi:hypothetical protein